MKTRTATTVSLTDKQQTPWQNLRQLLLCLLILLPGILTAQTIENPTFKARNGSIRNITRIERTPGMYQSLHPRDFPATLVDQGRWRELSGRYCHRNTLQANGS